MTSVCIPLICLHIVSEDYYFFSPLPVLIQVPCCAAVTLVCVLQRKHFLSMCFPSITPFFTPVNFITVNLNLSGLFEPCNFVIPRQEMQRMVSVLEAK